MSILRQSHKNPPRKAEKGMKRRKTRRSKRAGKPVEKPTVRIGKKGPTDELSREITKRLEKAKTVKVKILKTTLTNTSTERVAQQVAEQTGSRIIQLRGHTFILRRLKRS